MSKKPSERKCARCKEVFDIFKNDYIKEKNRFLHVHCYKEKELRKGHSEDIVNKAIDIFIQETKLEKAKKEEELLEKAQNSLQAKNTEVNRAENKELFVQYLKDTYGLIELPTSIYTRIANINSGNHKNFKVAIPYEDLLHMFRTKRKYLDKVYMNNISKGKEMTPAQRIIYDLAVMINKYDDYLNWKEKQKILEIEESSQKEEHIDYTKLKNTTKNSKNEIDILSILDDLY